MLWKKFNPGLVIPPILIFALGFTILYSVSPEHAKNQLLFFIVGVVVYLVFSLLNYEYLASLWKYFYFGNLLLLGLVFILGKTISGSTRWFTIFGFSIQPSEFAKFVEVLALGFLISNKYEKISTMRGLFKLVFPFLPFFILVFIQPDLGTTLILIGTLIGVLFYVGLNKLWFALVFFIFSLGSSQIWNVLKDYQKKRILVFLNPQLDDLGAGYNVVQSLIAIGSGGLFGKGFGRGSQSHLNFLPAYWTDFILASFLEEWGFIGFLILILFFVSLFAFILRTSFTAKDFLGVSLSIGVFMTIFSQFFVNVGMNLGLMPISGIPLPFMTYGGSALITNMAMLGLVQYVWINRKSKN